MIMLASMLAIIQLNQIIYVRVNDAYLAAHIEMKRKLIATIFLVVAN